MYSHLKGDGRKMRLRSVFLGNRSPAVPLCRQQVRMATFQQRQNRSMHHLNVKSGAMIVSIIKRLFDYPLIEFKYNEYLI